MRIRGLVDVREGIQVGNGNRTTHINSDGSFYRYDGQVYITVDDYLYIRDSAAGPDANASSFHFNTKSKRLGVGKTEPACALDVNGDVQASGKVTALSGITFSGSFHSANGQVTLKMHKHKKFKPNGTRHEYPVLHVRGVVLTGDIRARDKIVCNDLIVGPNPKKFRIDHPLDPKRKTLTHATLEGPEAGVYYRGEGELIGGRAVIALPPYFEALTRKEGRTVHITPRCEGDEPVSALAATGITDGLCTVRAIDDRNPSQRFCWEIKAVRADVPALEVERTKNSTSATDEELLDAE